MTLIEFGGLPGTGKSTLARLVADDTGAVWLRVDTIEAAMRRHGLTPAQTGIAAYGVAHDLAAAHLARGMTVVADAVNPVEAARAAWRDLARECGARHVVIEVTCPDEAEHRRRVEARHGPLDPDWPTVRARAAEYVPRADATVVVDTTAPLAACHRRIADALRRV